MKKSVSIIYGILLLLSILLFKSPDITQAAGGYCTQNVNGAWHDGTLYSRNYDYTTNYPRFGYQASSSSTLSTMAVPSFSTVDYYAPNQPSNLISQYGWSSSFWNQPQSYYWEGDSSTIADATTYTQQSDSTFNPYWTSYGWRFEDETGSFYQYRRPIRRDYNSSTSVWDGSAPVVSTNPGSYGWTNQNITINYSFQDVSCAGWDFYIWGWSNSNGANPSTWSNWIYSPSGSQTQSNEGIWYLNFQTYDNFSNGAWLINGPYLIDKTSANLTSTSISGARYINGTDYWVKPGDTVYTKIRGYDALSGIVQTYLRLYNASNDDRDLHDWRNGSTSNNEFFTGPYTSMPAVSETYNSGGYKEVQYTVNALANSNNQDFDLMAYFYDAAGNQNPNGTYFHTGYNLRVDGTAPTIGVNPTSSSGWVNTSQTANLSYSDLRSGVATQDCAWSTSTSKPTTWTNNCSTTTQSSEGTWYLHYQSTDNVGNYSYNYSGPYQIDLTKPSGAFSPSSSPWTASSVTTSFTPSDSGGSGVKQWRYRISNDSGNTYGSWSSYISGNTVQNISLTSSGWWVIQAEVTDNAGNINTVTSGTFLIDKTPPVGSISASTTNWTNQNVILTATGSDAHSGMQMIQLPDGSYVNGSSATYTATTNGTYTFTFVDNVGLTTTVSYTVTNIDKNPPFVWASSFSPNNYTSGNVNIQVNAGDDYSGVKQITLPNNIVVAGDNATYTVSQNGDYPFIVTDNAGNTYTYTVHVGNIDTTPPTLNMLSIVKKTDGTFDVTVDASDSSGIKTVQLNTGQIILKQQNKGTYFVGNLPAPAPTSVTIIDNAGNSTGAISFLDIPTNTVSPSGTTNQDVQVTINGTQTLSYAVGLSKTNCTSKPCTFTLSQNNEITATNSSSNKTSSLIFDVTNIDKADTLTLTGSRNNTVSLSLNWNLPITSSVLTCNTDTQTNTFYPTSNSYGFTGQNQTYECVVKGNYNGLSLTSNTVSIYPDYSQTVQSYTATSSIPTETFPKVYKEVSVIGETYFINVNRENTTIVPVPTYMQ